MAALKMGRRYYGSCSDCRATISRAAGRCRACDIERRHRAALIVPENFWAKVDRSGDCWPWLAGVTPKGYGSVPGATSAHRVAYTLTYGPVPAGLHVLHECDNPPCCRPDHLFLGTNADNVADRDRKGRQASKLNPEKVRAIRETLARGVQQKDVAAEFGMSQMAISVIATGKAWRHVQ